MVPPQRHQQSEALQKPKRLQGKRLTVALIVLVALVISTVLILSSLRIIPSFLALIVSTLVTVCGVTFPFYLHFSSHAADPSSDRSKPSATHIIEHVPLNSSSLELPPPSPQTIPPGITGAHLKTLDLPVPPTPLIGREGERAKVTQLLSRDDVRLVTLTGPGGVGKTRFALQLAHDLAANFSDGVVFVALAPIADPDLVIPTMFQALGIQEGSGQSPLERLKEYVQQKQMLLMLDNFEQVSSAAGQMADLLAACPKLKIIVTSREVLHVQAEHEYPVLPLALPDLTLLPELEALSHCAAVALFIQRSQGVKPGFQLTFANAATVAEICTRLDGLPLAIELAAARMKLLSPQALLTRLSPRLQILTHGPRDVPARQQTLRNTIAWSYQLLDAQEQRLFRRLCVFVGGCELSAVEALCTALGDGEGSAVDGVTSLIDKSLLFRTEQAEQESRFTMLGTIREYGRECLATSGEEVAVRHVHATYYLRLSEEAGKELSGPQQSRWLERLEREHDNLRAALQWSLEQGEVAQNMEMALLFSSALADFWLTRGYYSEGRTFLKQVLARTRGSMTPIKAKALNAAASLAVSQGDFGEAEGLGEEGLALSRRLEDAQGMVAALSIQSYVAWAKDNPLVASSLLREALALHRELGDKKGIAKSLYNLGWQAKLRKKYTRARVFLERSLAIQRELGDKGGIARTLHELAETLFREQGDSATVRARLKESRALFEEVGDKEGTAWVLETLGKLAQNRGDIAAARTLLEEALALYMKIGDQPAMLYLLLDWACNVQAKGEFVWAAQLCGKVEAMRESMGLLLSSVEHTKYEQVVATLHAQLGEKDFARAWAEGRAMTPEQVLATKK